MGVDRVFFVYLYKQGDKMAKSSINNQQKIAWKQYFLRWREGRLNESEQETLDAWLLVAENKKLWHELLSVWRAAQPPEIPQGTPVDAQWLHLANRLPQDVKTAPAGSFAQRLRSAMALPNIRITAIAAVAALVCILAYTFYVPPQEMQSVTVPFGEQLAVQLPDGSEVLLNSGSTLKYPGSFDDNVRLVDLSGEGYFKVEHGQIPFVVETEFASARVLGTEFNVRTWDAETVVFVNSGKVAVHSNTAVQASEVIVLPEQLAICKDGPITVQPTENPGDLLSWRHGRLVFTDQPLTSAVAEIQRRFNVRVNIDTELSVHSVTAAFNKEPVQKIVQALAASLNAKVVRTSYGYDLRVR